MSIKSLICRIEELEKRLKSVNCEPEIPISERECCIDDTFISTEYTWSSDKIHSLLENFGAQDCCIDVGYEEPELVLELYSGSILLDTSKPVYIPYDNDITLFLLKSTFTQKDAGQVIEHRLHSMAGLPPGGTPPVVESNDEDTLEYYTIANMHPMLSTSRTFYSEVDFEDGSIKQDINGIPNPNGRITAGTITSNSIELIGYYPIFYTTLKTYSPPESLDLSTLTRKEDPLLGMVDFDMNCIGEYLVIAIPNPYNLQDIVNIWEVNSANRGTIGEEGDLFGQPTKVSHTIYPTSGTPSTIFYDVYISNYLTTVDNIKLIKE